MSHEPGFRGLVAKYAFTVHSAPAMCRFPHFLPLRPLAACMLALSAWCGPGTGEALALTDLAEVPLEQLMDVEVVSASRYAQRIGEAPSSVTVVEADEIRRFGYRTLADILRGVGGFHVSYDRIYHAVGVRGFSPVGDYNTRLLVMIDGMRVNENIYDSGTIGGEFPLDVDLIERVEIVRGPSSSLYGSNAFFGVVNVISKRGEGLDGGELALATGGQGLREGRASYGRRFEGGAEVLLSASAGKRDGAALHFPEFDQPGVDDGITRLDDEGNRRFFAKLEQDGWKFSLVHARRDKGIATGAYGVVFDDPGNVWRETSTGLDLSYYRVLDSGIEASGRVFHGRYDYEGRSIYAESGLNLDRATGHWWGGEAKFIASLGRHKLTYGLEYQRNSRQDQGNRDVNPPATYLDDRRAGERWGAYLQDDLRLAPGWNLSAGLRFDHADNGDGAWSPRLGLIHGRDDGSVIKLLYGEAFRSANVYERYYAFGEAMDDNGTLRPVDPGGSVQLANPDLEPERIQTWEAVWERYFGSDMRLSASLYHYRIRDWIVLENDARSSVSRFVNLPAQRAQGAELEMERRWRDGRRLRLAYALQDGPDGGDNVVNVAPRHLFKAGLVKPLGAAWHLGTEYQFTGRRKGPLGELGGYGVANLSLLYRDRRGPELSLSVYNLFDRESMEPTADAALPDREGIVQDGRTWRLKLYLPF